MVASVFKISIDGKMYAGKVYNIVGGVDLMETQKNSCLSMAEDG